MGASITALGANDCAPLVIQGGPLHSITYSPPMASAQVKSAILFAGLYADGVTTVIEPSPSRDHTERMLEYFLVKLRREEVRPERGRKSHEYRVSMLGHQQIESRDFAVPGDISSAAFWLVTAACQPGSRLLVKNVGLNPTRTGILDVLVRMGARIREVVESVEEGEPSGVIDIKGDSLTGTIIEGSEVPNVIDELPVLAVAGALAQGRTIIRDAQELRFKETDRIAAIAANLRAMGVEVHEADDGMTIYGGGKLNGATLPSFGDHRIAMAFAIAGLFASGSTIIEDVACIRTSYPQFESILTHLQRGDRTLRHPTPVISSLVGKRRTVSILPKVKIVVAIDGPAASGKAALRGGFPSGSDFLTSIPVRFIVRSPGGSCAVSGPGLGRGCLRARRRSQIESGFEGDEAFLQIEGAIAKPHLRDENVNRSVSPVSVVPAVRDCLTGHLRELADCERRRRRS